MKIQPARNPDGFPKTRRELLSHLWAVGHTTANVFREGRIYALVCEGVISATHLSRIGSLSFSEWEDQCTFTGSLKRMGG